ncbi:MAG: aldehyde dehydrogenase [Planctomycetes bacterium]|nr:aldehyde dehydrogenase [Planctomycetota bacterium]
MLDIPIIRWGEPYESLEVDTVVHFATGEPLARVSQANTGLLARDIRKAPWARSKLLEVPCDELAARLKAAADLYLNATLPLGSGRQSPDDFARQQSATTGLPEHLCRANMQKNHLVLSRMDAILDALTRGLDLRILTRGYGVESRGVTVSYQAQADALGMVLPSNSPGVHTLWLPVIPLQVALVLKPGPQEPWTPYRMAAAFAEAGIPREAISIYPGGAEMGAQVVGACDRCLIFGGTATVERYRGNPRIQVHGPGFSKVLLGDDVVDDWERYVDLMATSVAANSGRGCINCSGIWASRHTREISEALAAKIGPVEPRPPEDPSSQLAAFTVPGAAQGIWRQICAGLEEPGVEHATARYGPRLVAKERCAYLRPTIVHCDSPSKALANTEYMFPFASVVRCPQAEMLDRIGSTLVATAITDDGTFQRRLVAARHIDRLNLGAIPTVQLDWFQPHEGSIVDLLFRARAFQAPEEKLAG